MVPLVKIPGEVNTTDLMTKHLVGHVLMKHVMNFNLDIQVGSSDRAANLHSVTRATTSRDVDEASPGVSRSVPGEDFWAEREASTAVG